ncbi:MAG: glycosyl hydrolase 53 family protein [Pseudonocardiales bacterium]|nr:glycosyl hydrolase 53 family protein [Pseudonocardiales bacterium]MBV9031698.1 glycosyl hydrolase 53 family protein [Pseudonocardiales bacterium]
MTELGNLCVRGADLSFTLLEEEMGNGTSDNDGKEPVERIIARHGANYVRLRVWVDPIPGWSDLESALVLARRAHEAGMRLLVDLHYSDTWADAANQIIPAAWRGQPLDTLVESLRTYTRDVVAAFTEQGTPVSMLQVGNEVTEGFLWPLGRIGRMDGEPWSEFTTLLRAGIMGARTGTPNGQELAIVIHTDRGGDNAGARHFYDQLLEEDVHFDVIGLSYYPFWHGRLADLQDNLIDLAARYDKDVLVVETAYPWTLESQRGKPSRFCTSEEQLPDLEEFPATPDGQAAYFEALRSCLQRVPDNRGLGFFVWEPAWLDGVGWEPGLPNPYGNLTLFDDHGCALPALRALRAPGV